MIRNLIKRPVVGSFVLIVVAGTGSTIHLCHASPENGEKKWTVDDLAWMAGAWKGTLFNGPIEEHWGQPANGVMIGMTRMGSDPARATYEFLMIEEKNGVPVMFIRHFSQHSKSREEHAMEFRLVEASGKRAIFESDDNKLTFSRVIYELSGDKYSVVLEGERNGKKHRVEGNLERSKRDQAAVRREEFLS